MAMDRQAEARRRYERLKKTLAADEGIRRKSRRARVVGLAVLGAWGVIPLAFWEVDLETVARREFFRRPTPHEAHLLDLARTRPAGPSPARDWESAAFRAIDSPSPIGSAYREVGVFPADEPQALGLRVHVPAGQRLRVTVEADPESLQSLFLDLFAAAPEEILADRREGGGGEPLRGDPRPAFVESGEVRGGEWHFDAARSGDYVLRLQPEFGAGARYQLSLQVGARWSFPVAGAGRQDIGSFFGDSRDGGRRDHHGVDIFMPRGTPVLAAADGSVTSVDTTGLGGRVVWQREAGGGHSLYYAHLDQALVRRGQEVRAGDTIGLVGNTGNARTTPPHLHFGAYRRGAVDPWNLILPIPPKLPDVAVDAGGIGGTGRVRREGAPARGSPSAAGDVLARLGEGDSVRVLAGAGAFYRILLPAGGTGFIDGSQVSVATPDGTLPSNQQ